MTVKAERLSRPSRIAAAVVGSAVLPVVWVALKYGAGVSDRFLPSPEAVFLALGRLEPNILEHTAATFVRVVLGLISGTVTGVVLGLLLWRSEWLRSACEPTVHSLRAVPATAVIPFVLIWLGFSEAGKILLVLSAVGLNLAIATHQSLATIDRRYLIAFTSFGTRPQEHLVAFAVPYALRHLLPTIRYSLGLALSTIVVTELLGSQTGLGYLIQTSRSTFSLHVILLACIILGVMTILLDSVLRITWKTFWPLERELT